MFCNGVPFLGSKPTSVANLPLGCKPESTCYLLNALLGREGEKAMGQGNSGVGLINF